MPNASQDKISDISIRIITLAEETETREPIEIVFRKTKNDKKKKIIKRYYKTKTRLRVEAKRNRLIRSSSRRDCVCLRVLQKPPKTSDELGN